VSSMSEHGNFESFWLNVMAPYYSYQDYIKKLSTHKLIKIAERLVPSHLPMWGVSEVVFDEMIHRLENAAWLESFTRMSDEAIKKELGNCGIDTTRAWEKMKEEIDKYCTPKSESQ
jgi:DNA-binding PadR family transcriptional regulator